MTLATPAGALHCFHCGRSVARTTHTRVSYHVDYYSLHTGEVEPTTVRRADDTTLIVFRLLAPREVVTCAECYEKPDVRAACERLYRPEKEAERTL